MSMWQRLRKSLVFPKERYGLGLKQERFQCTEIQPTDTAFFVALTS